MLHHMLKIAAALAALMALPLAAAPAAAQTRITDAPPVWKHRGTEVAFPDRIGDFVRADVIEYNAEGTDASAGYDLIRDGHKLATVTIYIYPPYTGGGCAAEYEAVKQGVLGGGYTDVRLVAESRAPSPTGKTRAVADLATFTFQFKFGGAPLQLVKSDAYAFCADGGQWIVSYRATWPADHDLSADVLQLFRAIDWPDFLDKR